MLRRPRPGELWPLPQPLWCVLSTPDENLVPSPETPGPRPGGTSPECLPPSTPGENFSALPPSLGEITNYFKEALGEAPNPEDKYCLRFERCLPFRWGPSWRRLLLKVSPSDAHSLTLEWWTNDDFGLSELREFFEAPFFHPSESKRFYRWLSEQGWHAAPFRDRHLLMGVLEQGGMVYVQIRWWRGLKNAHSPPF